MGLRPAGPEPMGPGPTASGPMGSGPMGPGPMGHGQLDSGPMGPGSMGAWAPAQLANRDHLFILSTILTISSNFYAKITFFSRSVPVGPRLVHLLVSSCWSRLQRVGLHDCLFYEWPFTLLPPSTKLYATAPATRSQTRVLGRVAPWRGVLSEVFRPAVALGLVFTAKPRG